MEKGKSEKIINRIQEDYEPAYTRPKRGAFGKVFRQMQLIIGSITPPITRPFITMGVIILLFITGVKTINYFSNVLNKSWGDFFLLCLVFIILIPTFIAILVFLMILICDAGVAIKEPNPDEIEKLTKLRKEQGEEAYQKLKRKELDKLREGYKNEISFGGEVYAKRRAEFLYAGHFHLMMQYEMMHLSNANKERITEVLKLYGYDFFDGEDKEFGDDVIATYRYRQELHVPKTYMSEELVNAQTKEIEIDEVIECFNRMYEKRKIAYESKDAYESLRRIIPYLKLIKNKGGIKNVPKSYLSKVWKREECVNYIYSVERTEKKEVEKLYAIDSARNLKAIEFVKNNF